MKCGWRQAHFLSSAAWRFRRTDLPKTDISRGSFRFSRVFGFGCMKLDAQEERLIAQRLCSPTQIDSPLAHIAGRDELILPLHLFFDLFAQELLVKLAHVRLFQALLKYALDIGLDVRFWF